jgi:hypothetical protein
MSKWGVPHGTLEPLSSEQQTEPAAVQYKDVSGNPVTLDWLVRNEPAWAANQIRHRDSLADQLAQSKEHHEYYRNKTSEFMGVNQELSYKLAQAIKERDEARKISEERFALLQKWESFRDTINTLADLDRLKGKLICKYKQYKIR